MALKKIKNTNFNIQVKVKRESKNLSQEQLAILSDVSLSTIANLERGQHVNISIDILRQISVALNYYEWDLYANISRL
jgi:transcriptional regulator with XRE-family HTH domain